MQSNVAEERGHDNVIPRKGKMGGYYIRYPQSLGFRERNVKGGGGGNAPWSNKDQLDMETRGLTDLYIGGKHYHPCREPEKEGRTSGSSGKHIQAEKKNEQVLGQVAVHFLLDRKRERLTPTMVRGEKGKIAFIKKKKKEKRGANIEHDWTWKKTKY